MFGIIPIQNLVRIKRLHNQKRSWEMLLDSLLKTWRKYFLKWFSQMKMVTNQSNIIIWLVLVLVVFKKIKER